HLEFEQQRYNLTAFEKVTGTLAEDIPPSVWTDDLFRSIGSAVGRLHRISSGYQPARPGFNRPHWFDSYEVQGATLRLFADSSDPAGGKLRHLIPELRLLPTSAEDYGLIHADLHFANFLVAIGGQVTVIDFDDCAYGWFAMDVAMALFDVLVLYNAGDEAESQYFARRFMTAYLSGYRQEYNLTSFWLSQIPKFLKLKELCIYTTLLGHADVSLPDTWVGRFMRNRAERIANDLPYVDIDFSILCN
ncbi:MAG TPA: phosphotransferase, partial [Anaerolineales bacterium]